MAAANINIRTDSELKAKAQSVLADLGLDLSTAINVYLNQIVYKHSIPFEISKQNGRTAKLGGWEGKMTLRGAELHGIHNFIVITAEGLSLRHLSLRHCPRSRS